VLIAIGSRGELAVNNRRIDLVDLKGELSKVPEPRRKAFPVIIRADRSALHGSVVSVIDVIRQVGFENVGMATKVMR
jgi:biopolymer transport protein ExbD